MPEESSQISGSYKGKYFHAAIARKVEDVKDLPSCPTRPSLAEAAADARELDKTRALPGEAAQVFLIDPLEAGYSIPREDWPA